MENLRRVAYAYYNRSDAAVRKEIQDQVGRLDVDGDGKISLSDLKKASEESSPTMDAIFRQLDVDKDGYLDFSDSVVLYYMSTTVMVTCDGCSTCVYGVYFSCKKCLAMKENSFDLCSDCYIKGVPHHHSTADLVDSNHSAILWRMQTIEEENGDAQRKRDIKQVQEIAQAYFEASSETVKASARSFFKSMDIDGNGSVDLREFLGFMNRKGLSKMSNPELFSELSEDGNNLSFDGVITLYYIIKSGRPCCHGCKKFIPGVFFSCIKCMASPKTAFHLCKACYETQKFIHTHDGKKVQLLDNYDMLHIQMKASKQSSLKPARVLSKIKILKDAVDVYDAVSNTSNLYDNVGTTASDLDYDNFADLGDVASTAFDLDYENLADLGDVASTAFDLGDVAGDAASTAFDIGDVASTALDLGCTIM